MTDTAAKENSKEKRPVIGVMLRANRGIGTGHLMRVKSLLPRLKQVARLHLYCYAFDEALLPLCSEYDAITIKDTLEELTAHCVDLGQHPEAHPDEPVPDVFIIDDYAIDRTIEARLYPKSRIFVVDDLRNRPHQCHMLLDQGIGVSSEDYRDLCNPECQMLTGSQYSLTRECFYPQNFDINYHSSCACGIHDLPLCRRVLSTLAVKDPAAVPESVKSSATTSLPRVFVSFGGADPVSACLKITKIIVQGALYTKYSFTMLAGAANQDYDAIAELITRIPAEYQHNFRLLHHCNDVADLLVRHDLAIGAYGGMFRERIAAGIPAIGIVIADNQQGADILVDNMQLGLNMELSQLSADNAVAVLDQKLKQLNNKADFYTSQCLKVYDGHGLERIIASVLSLLPQS